ncbi:MULTISPECIES: hypothetical protein [Nitrosomonas]|uniref:hypothetical protein n=1 Tax=Nitrosomonas TaxID=914 RepID=UPI0019378520|nr:MULTISPECIES: hypothetical protein [Nitrosomonas]MBV6388991.1 hypothetical protein [Nitrosomonas europaea]QOJ08460.1 MAG: hypothetical protein HRU73_02545 [Nitrosomonas sp. H1_AOB3]
MRLLIVFLLLLPLPSLALPQCGSEAILQAQKLLSFHVDGDDRAHVDPKAIALPSIRNPANRKQKFLVFEVGGTVYKGKYRMRLIYYPLSSECVLMGQEILELASP